MTLFLKTATLSLWIGLCSGCLARHSMSEVNTTSDASHMAPGCVQANGESIPPTLAGDDQSEHQFVIPVLCTAPDPLGLLGATDSRPESYWQDGLVYYRFHEDLEPETKRSFAYATRTWEQGVNRIFTEEGTSGRLRFVEDRKKREVDYLFIVSGASKSSSFSGKIGGEQNIKLKDDTASRRTILHELGHALGLTHEQSRCDRDQHVKIMEKNIIPGKESNFRKRCRNNEVLYAYNIRSIMHYSSDAFSAHGEPTIILKKDPNLRWEQSSTPHELDFQTVATGFSKHVFQVQGAGQ